MSYAYYKIKGDDEPPDDCEIFYSKEPKTFYSVLEIAVSECRFLNSKSIHHGQHRCWFEVEKVGEGKFAIVCGSHPAES